MDTDWQPNQREIVKDYIYGKEGLYCADIITFNTVALKGSVRDVCRALYNTETPSYLQDKINEEVKGYGKISDQTAKELKDVSGEYLRISNYICSNIEDNEEQMRKEYPKVFEYVDIINGTIVSIGTHPCGTIVSPIPLDESMGLCTISTCKRPVSMLSMKCVDAQNYTKLDILGLDNIQLINETCKSANIDRLIPENVPDDEKVWKSMAENNLLIFQWESDSAGAFLKTLLSERTIRRIKEKNSNFKYLDLVTMGNGAIRPAGASYRDALSEGEFRDNGHETLNKLLESTNGYLVYQEQIIEFLNKFCGFSMGKADIVRRGFAKKTGTDQFIPDIKNGFIKTMKEQYGVEQEEAEKLIVNFLQVIIDASEYLFSLNHSEPYTYIGYICAYLRYYYPLEFLTVALNINMNNHEKIAKIMEYAKSVGISLKNAKFGYSKGECFFDKDTNSIYKGIGAIKGLNNTIGNELYELSKNKYNNFVELIIDMKSDTSINSRQMETLIKLDYFSEFGKSEKLLNIYKYYQMIQGKKSPKKATILKTTQEPVILSILENHSSPTETTYKNLNWLGALNDITNVLKNNDISLRDKLAFQNEILGYIDYKNNDLDKRYVLIKSTNTKYTPVVDTYCLNNGATCKCKISKPIFRNKPVDKDTFIYIHKMEKKFGYKKVGEKPDGKPIFEVDETKMEWWIREYSIIEDMEEVVDG